jgi:hypothetical protein
VHRVLEDRAEEPVVIIEVPDTLRRLNARGTLDDPEVAAGERRLDGSIWALVGREDALADHEGPLMSV